MVIFLPGKLCGLRWFLSILGRRILDGLQGELAERYGIQTRAGAHCAPLMHEALKTRNWDCCFSFSHLNTREEAEMAVYAVEQLCREVE